MLSVEDDDAAFYAIRTAFEELPCSVQLLRAKNGADALALLRDQTMRNSPRQRPDLVLLDLNMPGLTGLEVLATIKKFQRLAAIPVVVFSSSSRDQDQRNSFALGAQRYIVKPNTFDGIVEAMKQACSVIPAQEN